MLFASAGYRVSLFDLDQSQVSNALDNILVMLKVIWTLHFCNTPFFPFLCFFWFYGFSMCFTLVIQRRHYAFSLVIFIV